MNITEIWNSWVKSWYNNDDGFSMRKRIGYGIFVLIIILSWKYADKSNLAEVLIILTSYSAALLGLTTWGNIKKHKINKENDKPEEK